MKDSLIFGSTAAKHWFPDFPREPHDLDLISKKGFMTLLKASIGVQRISQ